MGDTMPSLQSLSPDAGAGIALSASSPDDQVTDTMLTV